MRFFSPSILLLSLIVLPLPWIDLRWENKTLLRQHGFHTMLGTFKTAFDRALMEDADEIGNTPRVTRKQFDRAFLAIGWLGLVTGGAVLGFVLRPSVRRSVLVALFAGLASVCLIAQAFVAEFPLVRDIDP